jgi:hypothetical protein
VAAIVPVARFLNSKKMKMSNQYLFLLILFISSSCQVDNHSVLPILEEANYIEKADDFWATVRLQNYQGGKSFYYKTKSNVDIHQQKNELSTVLGLELTKHEFDLSWEYLNGITKKYIEKEDIDPLNCLPEYGVSLQFAALEIAHRAALKSVSSTERNEVLEYYMDVLLVQKGIDSDAMAELAKELKHIVSPEKYAKYKNYVLLLANQELKESMGVLNDYRSEIENAETESLNNAVLKDKVARYIDRYLSAKEALEILSSDS